MRLSRQAPTSIWSMRKGRFLTVANLLSPATFLCIQHHHSYQPCGIMSGIEVVGVVLGVWPVMLNVIGAWKATKGGVPEQSLLASIAGYSMVYRNAIAQLLQDESMSDKDRAGLLKGDEEFAAIWKDAEFQARLHRRLEGPAFTVLQQKSAEIFKILKSLQKKIDFKDGDLVSWSTLSFSFILIIELTAGSGKRRRTRRRTSRRTRRRTRSSEALSTALRVCG
jgi:hypothetical protein